MPEDNIPEESKRQPGETPGEWAGRIAVGSSKWKEKMEWRRDNRYWLNTSRALAFRILNSIRSQGIDKEKFKTDLNLSEEDYRRILGGKENFDLKQICQIQDYLKETIFFIPNGVCRFCDENPIPYGVLFCIPCEEKMK